MHRLTGVFPGCHFVGFIVSRGIYGTSPHFLKEKAPEKAPVEGEEKQADVTQEQQSQDTSEQEKPKQEVEPAGTASQTEAKVCFIKIWFK